MAPRMTTPVGVYAVKKVGWKRALRALTFVVSWGIAADALGHPLANAEEHAAYWKQSLSTSYRELDAFRLVFPDEKYPDRIWATARESVTQKRPELAVVELMGVTL